MRPRGTPPTASRMGTAHTTVFPSGAKAEGQRLHPSNHDLSRFGASETRRSGSPCVQSHGGFPASTCFKNTSAGLVVDAGSIVIASVLLVRP
jgi:hypothetical protein